MASVWGNLFKREKEKYFLKWLILSFLVGSLSGSASAVLLHGLTLAEKLRAANLWLIILLPFAGFIVGWIYLKWGKEVVKGNNQIIEEYYEPNQIIPLKMAPLVLVGTFFTHFFGGSAGREGTAVQMGASIADQFTTLFHLNEQDRRILLVVGVSAGFASVFGTPAAGAVFALEVLVLFRKSGWQALLPSIMVAYVANFICDLWQVDHSMFVINNVPSMSFYYFNWTVLVGFICGLSAMLFAFSTRSFGYLFSKCSYAPLRPFVGGLLVVLGVFLVGSTRYIGLGVPTIEKAFLVPLEGQDFLLKILFTAVTLGAGFKGGEVTPLFFIGATLGNALVWFVPLPMALLAGIGFVAVFSGATNTPVACMIMGVELFGFEGIPYFFVACLVSYLSSGYTGIYSSQFVASKKYWLYPKAVFGSNKPD